MNSTHSAPTNDRRITDTTGDLLVELLNLQRCSSATYLPEAERQQTQGRRDDLVYYFFSRLIALEDAAGLPCGRC